MAQDINATVGTSNIINITLSNPNPVYLKNQPVDATFIENAAAIAYSNAAADATSKAATAYSNAVANSSALYQTTAGLSANVLTLTSNNSTNFDGLTLGTLQSQITGNAATSYSNSVTSAASLYAPLTGSTFTGPVSGITTLAAGNTTITGFANVTDNIYSNTYFANSKINVGSAAGFNFGTTALVELDGSQNTFVQIVIQNANTQTNASSDLVVTSDTGNNTQDYIDLGINSSTYNNSQFTIGGSNDGYLYASNGALAIGTAAAKPIVFHANGTLSTNEVMRIGAGANVGIGNTAPNAKLQVTGTANISGAVALGSSLSITGAASGITTLAAGNTTITGFANVSTTLQVGTNTATFGTAAYLVANGNMGIGTASPVHPLQVAGNGFFTGNFGIGSSVSASQSLAVSKIITGGVTSTGISQNGTVQSDVTTAARGFFNTLNFANNTTFTTTSYSHYGTINSRPTALNATITNLYGFQADNTLVSGVINYGFLGSIPASSASTITNVSLTTNVVTVTTAAAHVFWPGQTVIVAATTTTSINGSFTVLTCPSTTTFTYALVLGDIVSTADTGTATVSSGRWNAYMLGTAPNYFAGQVSIGTTNLTNGYLIVAGTQSSAISMSCVGGTNQSTGTSVHGLFLNSILTGTSAVTTSYGFQLAPIGTFATGATVGNFGGINNNPSLSGAVTPTNYYGIQTQQFFGAGALGGTVTTAAAYQASNPSFNAATTTNITTYVAFRASSASNSALNTITNIYAFQGLQATSATSNAYNLFMSGTAKNYLAGNTGIGNTTPDATLAVTGTANVSGAVAFASTLAAGNTTITGALTTSTYVKTTATVVASLVAAATAGAGARSFVTDSTLGSGNFGNAVVGGGANPVPVYSDGTNWRIG